MSQWREVGNEMRKFEKASRERWSSNSKFKNMAHRRALKYVLIQYEQTCRYIRTQ